jgi:hypothetical protein
MDKYTGASSHPLQASKAELTDFVEKQANINTGRIGNTPFKHEKWVSLQGHLCSALMSLSSTKTSGAVFTTLNFLCNLQMHPIS